MMVAGLNAAVARYGLVSGDTWMAILQSYGGVEWE